MLSNNGLNQQVNSPNSRIKKYGMKSKVEPLNSPSQNAIKKVNNPGQNETENSQNFQDNFMLPSNTGISQGVGAQQLSSQNQAQQRRVVNNISKEKINRTTIGSQNVENTLVDSSIQSYKVPVKLRRSVAGGMTRNPNINQQVAGSNGQLPQLQQNSIKINVRQHEPINPFLHRNQTISKEREMPKIHSAQSEEGRGLLEVRLMSEEQQRRKKIQINGGNKFVQSPQFSQPSTTKPNADSRAMSNFYKEYKPQNTLPIGSKYAQKIIVGRGETASMSGRRTIGTPNCQEQPTVQKLNSEKLNRDGTGLFNNTSSSMNKAQIKQPSQKFKNLNEFMQTQYKILSSQQSSFQGQIQNIHSSSSLQQHKNTEGHRESNNEKITSNSHFEDASLQTHALDSGLQKQNIDLKKQNNTKKIDQLQQFINLVDLSNSLELEQRRNVNLSPEMIGENKLNVTFTNHGGSMQGMGINTNENQYSTQQKFYNHKSGQIKSKSQNPSQNQNQQNHFFHLSNQKPLVNRNPIDVKKMLIAQQQKLSQSQQNNGKVDHNMWLHFKNLLSLEQNGSMTNYEKQALASIQAQIQNKSVNDQQLSINLKHFLENYSFQNNNQSQVNNENQNNEKVIIQHNLRQGILNNFKHQTSDERQYNMNSPITTQSNQKLTQLRPVKTSTEINFNNQTQQAAKIQQALSDEMMLDNGASGKNSTLKMRKSPGLQFQDSQKIQADEHQQAMQKGIQEVAENIQRLTDYNKRQENGNHQNTNGIRMMNENNPYKDSSQPTININKLNVNIQQFQNPGLNTANSSIQQESSFSQKTSIGSFVQQVPMSMKSTLFIMDCQTLGLLSNQKLLNLEQQKQMPFSQDIKEQSLSEVQIISFIQSRAEISSTTLFKEMPKLSEEAKRILNTIKAQQHLNVIDEIPKLTTLLIEIDYLDYKNQLLQALFNIYGDKVLENLVHQIDIQSNNTQHIFQQFKQRNFQSIMEYMEKIRNFHSDQVKKNQEQIFTAGNLFMTEKETQIMNSKEDWTDELELLFPKNLEIAQSSNVGSRQSLEKPDMKKVPSASKPKNNKSEIKKLKKKVNFHVVVKNTKLYRSLIYANLQFQYHHKLNLNKELKEGQQNDNQQNTSQNQPLSDLSPFVLTQDPTLLRFVLFCQHVGIIKSAQSFLRHLFQNVFIIIRPGSRNLSNGSIQHLLELPRIDVEKINKYLEQQQLKREANEAAQKMLGNSQSPSRTINNTYVVGQNMTVNQKSNTTPYQQSSHTAQKNKSQNRYHNKEERIQAKSTLSLNSYKSHSLLDQQQQKQQMQTLSLVTHFNSLQSSIKTELPQPHLIPTIKVFHEPYTHYDNSKIQKAFKIYNEFIQLTFKNRIIHTQNDTSHQHQDFSKVDQLRILKLGQHMGIKNLPKRQTILRTPLLDCFRNHRTLGKIKEQMMRFIHRILNEENGITARQNKCLIIGQGFTIDQTKEQIKIDGQQSTQENEGQSQSATITVQQKQTFYKYQVGYGNNHQLIKNLFKQRWWWHQINQGKDMFKLDFDEAQIMWTQWCKGRLYSHLVEHSRYNEDHKDLLQLINTDSTTTNQDTADRADTQNQTNKLAKAERFQDKMKAYCQSTSPIRPEVNQRKRKTSSFKVKKAQEMMNSAEHEGEPEELNSPLNKEGSDQENQIEEENYSGEEFEVQEKNQVLQPVPIKQTMMNTNIKEKIEICKKKLQKIYNRLEFNQHLNNKKALFINMRNYYTYCCDNEDVFNTLPLTFHIKDGISDPQFEKFKKYYEIEKLECQKEKSRKNIWIVKPGENSNRGTGIKVEQNIGPLTSLVGQYCCPSQGRSCIMQKYIDNPLLYQRRKFDIRCFSLVTCINGTMKAYFYRDGYIRTSSKEFSLNNLGNKYVHLVNDAVQKYADNYGQYETANKLSYQEFQKYWTNNFPEMNINVERDVIMQVKKIVTDTIRATFHLLDSKKRLNSYELFGYDFMFDNKFKPYLIEVNSNPSLEVSSTLLAKLFTSMLDNTFRIAIDPLFPPQQEGFSMKKSAIGIEMCPENRFDLIFDERVDGPFLLSKFNKIDKKVQEEVDGINELEGSDDEDAVPNGDQVQEENIEQEIKKTTETDVEVDKNIEE